MGVSKYSEEFRKSAVELVNEKGKNAKQVGAELGIDEKRIQHWLRQYEKAQRSESVRINELEREVRQLKREQAESQERVEILKKAAAILSKR